MPKTRKISAKVHSAEVQSQMQKVMADKKKQGANKKSITGKVALLAGTLAASIKSNPGAYIAGLGSIAVGGYAALKNKTSPPSHSPEQTKPANPFKTLDAFLRNGTFGTLKADAARIDGVVLSRGQDASKVFKDPNNAGAGLILCPKAMKLFNKHSDKPEYQSEQGYFKLAMVSAIKVRERFLGTPVMGDKGQNDLASYHVADSRYVPGGSPFLSLTLNDPSAAFFGAGGYDSDPAPGAGGYDSPGHEVKPNKNGKVFKGSVNNESTIFPIIGGKTKGVAIGRDPQKMADRGMVLTNELKVPTGELVIVGGYYFNDVIELEEAFSQNPEQFRSVSDLEYMSSQMLDSDKDTKVSYDDFRHHATRIQRQQGIDLNKLN